MALSKEHPLHERRRGRNIGVGLLLGAFIVLVFALTFVKITGGSFEPPRAETGASE